MGKRASFCLLACGLAKTITAGSYFGFLMRRVAAAVIPSLRRRLLRVRLRSALRLPCSRACRRSYLLACRCSSSPAWWSLAGYFRRSRTSRWAVSPRPVGAEPEGGAVSVGFAISGEAALSAVAFCLFVCLAGVVIGRLRFFQIVEERISPGYELVGMGFILPCSKFTVINSSFLPFEAVAALAELRFARVFLRFCRH